MNPPKSLMGFFVALVLLPAGARAEPQNWKPIQTPTQTYFIAKADFPSYEEMKKTSPSGPLPLWVWETDKDGKLTKVRSVAVLGRTPVGLWFVTVNRGNGGNYSIAVDPLAPYVPAAKAQRAAIKKPADVSEGVWNAVLNSGIPQERWGAAAAVMMKIAAERPEAFAKVNASSRNQYRSVLNKIVEDLSAGKPEAEIVGSAGAVADAMVPTIMAARNNVATVAGSPVPGEAGAPDEGNHAVSVLAALLDPAADGQEAKKGVTSDTVRQAVVARVAEYLIQPEGENSFISEETRQKNLATAAAEIRGGVETWAAEKIQSAEGRGQMATLYFVMGDAPKPWFASFPQLAYMSRNDNDMRKDFDGLMAIYTVKGGAADPSVAKGGPYDGRKEWIPAVLEDAVAKAAQIFNDRKFSKEGIGASVRGSEENDTMPPGSIGAGGLQGLLSNSFGVDDLYVKGSKVAMLQIPGSDPPKYRRLSIKLYTKRGDFGPPAQMINEIGIYDISEPGDGRAPSNIYGQRFPISQSGESVFRLDDRRPDSIRYKLTMQGGAISFVGVDPRKNTPVGEAMTTSVGELYDMRAQQVADTRYKVTVNKKSYYVIGQGGAKGTFLYYPLDGSGQPSGDTPEMLAEVSQIGAGSYAEVIRTPRPLGYIGFKEDGQTPQFYNLVWDDKIKHFVPKAGERPKDEPKEKPAAAATTADAGPQAGKGTAAGENESGAGDAGDSDVAQGSLSKECSSAVSFNELARQQYKDGWTIFLGRGNKPIWILCMNKTQYVQFPGTLPWKIEERGDAIVIETLSFKEDNAPDYFNYLADAAKTPGETARLREDPKNRSSIVLERLSSGGGVEQADEPREVTGRSVHYIPTGNLKPEVLKSVMDNFKVTGARVEHSAEISLVANALAPEAVMAVNIYMRGADGAQARERMAKAFALVQESPFVRSQRIKAKILDFAAREVESAAGAEGGISSDGHLIFTPLLGKELPGSAETPDIIISTMQSGSGHRLRYDPSNKDVVVK